MAFENVNVASLRSAITSCKNSINYNNSLNCLEFFSDNNSWNTKSKNKLNIAMNNLINESYNNLEETLEQFLKLADLISKYKMKELMIESSEKRILELEPRLYYEDSFPVTTTDEYGNVIVGTETRTVKNNDVEAQISNLKYEINSAKQEMIRLENEIRNSF